jgi:hypothetical protein
MFVFSLLFSCVGYATAPYADSNNFKALMHGIWAEIYTDEGEILSYMSYIPAGRFHAYGYFDDSKTNYWFADGIWKMRGNQSCIVFEYDSFEIMDRKEEMCVTILSVTTDELRYLDNDDGKIETLKRVSNGRLE